MYDLILDFLSSLIEDALAFFGDGIASYTSGLINNAFHAEDKLGEFMQTDLSGIETVICSFALYLIVLKLLKKGFDTYILWSDGDADLDPFTLLTGFFKAVIITLCFGKLYDLMIDISTDMINKILEKITKVDASVISISDFISQLLLKGLGAIIVGGIFLILYLILYLKLLKKGLELFTLKVGISLACVGLMDSDGGVFKPYIKKFFQEIFGVMLQIVWLKMALFLMLGSHYLWGFAAMSLALSAPQFLSEFVMLNGGGGGGMNKISSTMYMASMAKNLVK